MTKIPSRPTLPERPLLRPPALLRAGHRLSALVLAAYALPHLFNHLLALGGAERHIGFMRMLRQVVRVPAVEALLLACVAFQVVSGMTMLVRRRRPGRVGSVGRLARAQALSGAYLAFFLLVHVGAVLNGRLRLGLDTNFYFAAVGLSVLPFALFFAPYYAAAIVALAVHTACALRRLRPRSLDADRRVVIAGVMLGAVLAAAIVPVFAGMLYPVAIPPAYLAVLGLGAPSG
jgi:succinate dehydrogenase/fumarate reductase cytochrome b subunit